MAYEFPEWQAEKWKDPRTDWLITPKRGFPPKVILGDPQVILPGEFDRNWLMFLIGRGHFFRLSSPDGLDWKLDYDYKWNSGPTCITCDGRQWIAYYSLHRWPESADSTIVARTSQNLETWSEPVTLIAPELDWEKEGRVAQVRNPNLVILPDGRCRLYYCGGTVWMDDMNFEEPKYIGYAEADNPLGPFKKAPRPILTPDPQLWYRAYSAGAIKVYRYGTQFLGMENGVYHDKDRHSRAAIDVLLSDDGLHWESAPYNPIILPTEGPPKKALIYQLDLRYYAGKLWLYYNAREGWAGADEGICCATLDWKGSVPEKLWKLP